MLELGKTMTSQTTPDGLGPLPARWYVLDRDGLATLCKDQEDAQEVAAGCFVQWPQRGPYRVVMLGDVAAERERCAAIAAPERIPFSDDEWRVRCEIRDEILGL